jgi:hypothetical protein
MLVATWCESCHRLCQTCHGAGDADRHQLPLGLGVRFSPDAACIRCGMLDLDG